MDEATNVIVLNARRAATRIEEPTTILERVYTAGSLALPVDETATRMAALVLQSLGFIVIDQVLADGTTRRLRKGESRGAMDRPWRLAKAPFSEEAGRTDAGARRSD